MKIPMRLNMGKRGELWVLIQGVIFLLVLLSPAFDSFPFPLWLRAIAVLVVLGSGVTGTLGVVGLGRNLSPFPKPKSGGYLVSSGIYSVVRHPICTGIIFGTLGWSLITNAPLGILLAIALLVFFELKTRREENWLMEFYPEYSAYRQRVKKLIPFIY